MLGSQGTSCCTEHSLLYFLLCLVWKEDMEMIRTSMSEAVISEETELKEFRKKNEKSHIIFKNNLKFENNL